VRYSWNFGDGTPAGSGPTTTHVYTAANTYTVTLTVSDDLGAQKSTTVTVVISP
jgi:PKD repeat protein